MADEVAVALGQYRAIGLELGPDFELAVALDVPERGVELQVRLEISGVEQLDLHRVLVVVVKDYFLSVELIID